MNNCRNTSFFPYSNDRIDKNSNKMERFMVIDHHAVGSTSLVARHTKPPVTQIILNHTPNTRKERPKSPTSIDYQDISYNQDQRQHHRSRRPEKNPKNKLAPLPQSPLSDFELRLSNKQVLQVGPGFWVYLRQAEETIHIWRTQGIQSLQITTCCFCSVRVACVRDAEFVKCPECHFTNLNGNKLCHGGSGLAIGININDFP